MTGKWTKGMWNCIQFVQRQQHRHVPLLLPCTHIHPHTKALPVNKRPPPYLLSKPFTNLYDILLANAKWSIKIVVRWIPADFNRLKKPTGDVKIYEYNFFKFVFTSPFPCYCSDVSRYELLWARSLKKLFKAKLSSSLIPHSALNVTLDVCPCLFSLSPVKKGQWRPDYFCQWTQVVLYSQGRQAEMLSSPLAALLSFSFWKFRSSSTKQCRRQRKAMQGFLVIIILQPQATEVELWQNVFPAWMRRGGCCFQEKNSCTLQPKILQFPQVWVWSAEPYFTQTQSMYFSMYFAHTCVYLKYNNGFCVKKTILFRGNK